jgi:WD40 repeat protein
MGKSKKKGNDRDPGRDKHMFLKPDGKIDLKHRAYFLRAAPQQSLVLAATEDGQLSIIDVTSGVKVSHALKLPSKIRAVSPHPSGQCVALVDGVSGSLTVQNLNGSRLVEIAAPQIAGHAPPYVKQQFDDCHFDETGEFLWLAASHDAEQCEIQLVETAKWSLVQRTLVGDPFGGSNCSFHRTGKVGLTSLWLAAGQDGQQVYWLNRVDNSFSCTLEPHLTDTIPPVFSPDGKHLLVVNDEGAICKYSFPKMRQIGSSLKLKSEDDSFAESLCYLNERHALATTREQRIFLVDTGAMTVAGEVSVEGHEPRPIGEYYPTLAEERGLGTDISYFERMGNVIVFVYRRDRGVGLDGWKDTLLWSAVKG